MQLMDTTYPYFKIQLREAHFSIDLQNVGTINTLSYSSDAAIIAYCGILHGNNMHVGLSALVLSKNDIIFTDVLFLLQSHFNGGLRRIKILSSNVLVEDYSSKSAHELMYNALMPD